MIVAISSTGPKNTYSKLSTYNGTNALEVVHLFKSTSRDFQRPSVHKIGCSTLVILLLYDP